MYELSKELSPDDLFIALPSDGCFFQAFAIRTGSEHLFKIPRQAFSVSALFRLWRWSIRHRINIVHSHGKGAGVYSRILGVLLGVPVIHTLHGYHDDRYGRLSKKLYALWESLAACFTTRIICVSQSERVVFLENVHVDETKVSVILNGTPVLQVDQERVRQKKIVTVARFSHQKNLREFVDIAQRLPQYVFQIIGDGEERSALEAYIEKKHVKNLFLSGESHDVASEMVDAEVYLSTALTEGLPLAVLEAMSLGIPVVATDVVGNRDAVKSGVTGYLYQLGDLAGCIRQIEASKLLDRTAIRSYHRAHFSSSTMTSQTLGLYRDVLVGKK